MSLGYLYGLNILTMGYGFERGILTVFSREPLSTLRFNTHSGAFAYYTFSLDMPNTLLRSVTVGIS